MVPPPISDVIRALPKAELHLHLEGSIEPPTMVELAARHGMALAEREVAARYSYSDFRGFLEAFKWAMSFLREPADYGLITRRLAEKLVSQNVVYAEVFVAVGVLFRQEKDVEACFRAIRAAGEEAQKNGLRMQWIFDATRQFGPDAAMAVAQCAARWKNEGVVAFGMGGDELSIAAKDFRGVYDFVATAGLHRHIHAGEVGGAQSVRDSVRLLGAERIGHGIGAIHDPALVEALVTAQTPLEICPTSNLRTGALGYHLGKKDAKVEEHPLRDLCRQGMLVTLSTDDPAMFQTSLLAEYDAAARMGLTVDELARLAAWGFVASFLPAEEKTSLLRGFHSKREALGL
jgi:adenosine deaminase